MSEATGEPSSRGGTAIGTLRSAEGKIGTFNGVVYVQVADIQASCQKASQLTRTVVPGIPFNLNDGIGAIALIVDPPATRSACVSGGQKQRDSGDQKSALGEHPLPTTSLAMVEPYDATAWHLDPWG